MTDDDTTYESKCLERILSMLESAGYSKSRSSMIDWFDKLVGGLCWGICASGYSLNVDLIGEDSVFVGQKIRLCEIIVSALRDMKCPLSLQAHQIQGGDFASLEPVIKWLIESVEYFRSKNSRKFRKMALYELDTRAARHGLYVESGRINNYEYLEAVRNRYEPQRRFKIDKSKLQNASEDARIRAVLLEFDDRSPSASMRWMQDDADNDDIGEDPVIAKKYQQLLSKAKADYFEKMESARILEENLLSVRCGTDSVPHVVSIESSTVDHARVVYEKKLAEITYSPEQEARNLRAELQAQEACLIGLQQQKKTLQEQEISMSKTCRELESRIELLDKALTSMPGVEDPEIAPLIEQLYNISEEMRNLETKHTEEFESLERDLKLVRSNIDKTMDTTRMMRIETQLSEVRSKHQICREDLATENQHVATISREIDDIPTKAELIQYKRRYIELHEQLATKLEENRRHVTSFNALNTTFELLKKEISLLQSIGDEFKNTVKSINGRQSFIQQFEHVLEGLRQRAMIDKNRLDVCTQNRVAQQEVYQAIAEQHRSYFRAVKEFQVECDLYDQQKAALDAATSNSR